MNGIVHFIVIVFGIFGMICGGVLVDLDHAGTWKCKWDGFWGRDASSCNMHRGIFHKPIFIWSVFAFCLCLAIGILIHMILDYLYIGIGG